MAHEFIQISQESTVHSLGIGKKANDLTDVSDSANIWSEYCDNMLIRLMLTNLHSSKNYGPLSLCYYHY